MNIGEFRKQYPQYQDLSDHSLATALHETYYADVDFNDFAKSFGVSTPGDFSRGVQIGIGQAAPLAKGLVGLAGATAEKAFGEGGISTAVKEWGLKGYQEGMEKLQPLQHENDSVTTAWQKASEGDVGALVDWAQYGLGYGLAQMAETAVVGVAGGIVGGALSGGAGAVPGAIGGAVAKQATKGAIKELIEGQIAKRAGTLIAERGLTQEAATQIATKSIARDIGAATALTGYNVGVEGGSIYPEAVKQAHEEGRELTGSDLARVWGAATVAGASETIPDLLGLGALTGRLKGAIPGGSRATRAGVGAVGGMALEGGQEAFQTAVEHYGAGQPIADEAGLKDIIDSAALGALGGGVVGGVAGGLSRGAPPVPVTAPPPAAPTTPEIIADVMSSTNIDEAIQRTAGLIDSGPDINAVVEDTVASLPPRTRSRAAEQVGIEAQAEAQKQVDLDRLQAESRLPVALADAETADTITQRSGALDVAEAPNAMQLAFQKAGIQKPEDILPAPSPAEIDARAHEAATSPLNDHPEPTQPQKEAGNYRVGKFRMHGLEISVENPRGSVRSGVDENGQEYSGPPMPAHYGYIRKTTGADGDQVDVFVGPSIGSPRVFVVDQKNARTGKFDESKALLAFRNRDDAVRAYLGSYADDARARISAISEASMEDFKRWAREGDTKRPFSESPVATQVERSAPASVSAAPTEPAPAALAPPPGTPPVQQPPVASATPESVSPVSSVSSQPGAESVIAPAQASPSAAATAATPPAAKPVESPPQQEAAPIAGFDSEAFDKRRSDAIAASKAAGNTHLDSVTPAVESMRGREIYSAHDPKERGVVRTVANTGEVVVHWTDKYSSDRNFGTEKQEGKKTVFESWLQPSDLKDYVFTTKGTMPPVAAAPIAKIGGKPVADMTDGGLKTVLKAGSAKIKAIAQAELDRRDEESGAKATREAVANPDLRASIAGFKGAIGRDEVGGKLIIDETTRGQVPGTGDIKGRTSHTGNPLWFAYTRTDPIPATVARRAIDKVLEGKPLGPREQRFVNYVVAQAKEQDEEIKQSQADIESEGLKPTSENKIDHDLLYRAVAIDPIEVDNIAIAHEGDDVAFMSAIKEFVDARERAHAEANPSGQENSGTPQGEAATAAAEAAGQVDDTGGIPQVLGQSAIVETGAVRGSDVPTALELSSESNADILARERQAPDTKAIVDREAALPLQLQAPAGRVSADPLASPKNQQGLFTTNQPAANAPSKVAEVPEPRKGDRFTDAEGKTWEVWSTRHGSVEAFPVINGKIVVHSGNSQRWAIDALSRDRNPEFRTDYTPQPKARQGATPQVPPGNIETYIKVAADSIEQLREADVYRVLVESNRAEFRQAIASFIKAKRPDLVKEVDSVLAEEATPAAKPVAEMSAADHLRAAAAKMDGEAKPAGISDFGEKIGGARKDYAQAYKDKIADASSIDIASEPLSKSWPEPDYQKLLDEGADPWSVAFAHAARDEIPTKPQQSWKLKRWVESVQQLRDFTGKIMSGEMSPATVRERMGKDSVLRPVADRAELYIEVGHDKSLKGIRINQGSYSLYGGVEHKPPKIIWTVEGKSQNSLMSRWPKEYASGATRAEAIANFKEKWNSATAVEQAENKVEFSIYGRRTEKNFFVGKKIGKNIIPLKDGFATAKEARQWKDDNQAELEATLAKFKTIPNERRENNSPRVGEDHRGGANVTPEQFSETFGFRGVEFGNYVEGPRRQADLNEAYDALMDLAGVIDIPPKALSLNGELGLAFGARGMGGRSAGGRAPAAHYEPGHVVINLTKEHGAGSIGHEWFHSVDNYFSRMRGNKGGFVTDNPQSKGEGVRPEMIAAFTRLVQTINSSGMRERARKLDKSRSNPYWSTGLEMAARSFESYVIAKLQDQGASNDYLANIVSQEYWDAAAALGMEKENTYPYPAAAEIPAIRAAFDDFFKTVETKETDKGVAMFSRNQQSTPGLSHADVNAVANLFRAQFKGMPPIHIVKNPSKATEELYKAVKKVGGEQDTEGAWHNGEIWLFEENLISPEHVARVILHEGTHHGLRGMFGNALDPTLMTIYMGNPQVREAANKLAGSLQLSKVRATEEVLANMGGENLPQKIWERLVAGIRSLLRRAGVKLDITDNDVKALVADALRFVKEPQAHTHLMSGTVQNVRSEADQENNSGPGPVHRGAQERSEAAAGSESSAPMQASVFSRAHALAGNAPEWVTKGSKALQSAASKIDTFAPEKSIGDKIKELTTNWQGRLVQGLFDAYAPLKDLSPKAYILARMTKSADGALEGMLMYGKPMLDKDGAVYGDLDGKGFLGAMKELTGEHDRFFMWIAGNRAGRLAGEDREHLFSADEIAAMKELNRGKMEDGSSREAAYMKALGEYTAYSKSVLDIAEKTGLIDGEARHLWEHDFYVPFYRTMEDDRISGPSKIKGLVRQQAFKKLKGGEENLGDLMANTLRNWSHLLSASLANQAAVASLQAAEKVGVAAQVSADTKGATFAMVDGKQVHYEVSDPFVLEAISAIEHAGFKGLPMELMRKFKHYLTMGVTASPAFRIRNLMRDTISAIGQNDISYNMMNNLVEGFKGTNKKSNDYAQMLFGGGVMRFGTNLEDDRAEHVKRLINDGVDQDTILDNPRKVKAALGKVWDAWQDFGDRMENVNRAALYKQMIADGKSHQEAAFAARDMLDFSMQGSFTAVRFLTQIVPFANARAQGLYKLGRAAQEDPRRLSYVTGAVALASIALLLAYDDDEDWKKREDFDRDGFWWFKAGGVAFRIPKPFEIGAIGTLAERSVELMINKEMTGKRFAERMQYMIGQTFSMNPVPQMFKPMLDIYSNVDSFTGRQIETRGMENLSKSNRQNANTSLIARVLGSAGDVTNISPIQVDHIIRGYFGWLGTHTAMTVDLMAQPFQSTEKPSRKIGDMFVVGDFVKDLPANQSRYVEEFYKQAKAVSEVMGDIKRAREVGEIEKARELMEDNKDKVALHRLYSHAERQMGNINKQIRITQGNNLSGDEKRARLDQLMAMRNKLAETVSQRASAQRQ